MLRLTALVRTDVSEDRSAYIMRVVRLGELETTIAVTSSWSTLRRNTKWEMKHWMGYKSEGIGVGRGKQVIAVGFGGGGAMLNSQTTKGEAIGM
jgi:hypothetical protein